MRQLLVIIIMLLIFRVVLANANNNDPTVTEVTIVQKKVNFNPIEISKTTVTELTQGKISEHIDQTSKKEVAYTDLDFWSFPVKIIVSEATNRFTYEDGQIKKEELLESKPSKNVWKIELCWRIMPILLLFSFLVQRKGVDYLSLGIAVIFSTATSIYLIYRLGWEGSSMSDYLLYAIIITLLVILIRSFLPKPKEEKPITLSELLKTKNSKNRKKAEKIRGMIVPYQERPGM